MFIIPKGIYIIYFLLFADTGTLQFWDNNEIQIRFRLKFKTIHMNPWCFSHERVPRPVVWQHRACLWELEAGEAATQSPLPGIHHDDNFRALFHSRHKHIRPNRLLGWLLSLGDCCVYLESYWCRQLKRVWPQRRARAGPPQSWLLYNHPCPLCARSRCRCERRLLRVPADCCL